MITQQSELLGELVKLIVEYGSADKLLREHRPDRSGHCALCHSRGCTLFHAAQQAKHAGATS